MCGCSKNVKYKPHVSAVKKAQEKAKKSPSAKGTTKRGALGGSNEGIKNHVGA